MLLRLFAFLFLVKLSRADPTNSTTTECPSSDATACDYRSVWSILASCGLTLLICVWHAVHPNVPLPHYKWYHIFVYRLLLMGSTFFAPEFILLEGYAEWDKAREISKRAHGASLSIELSHMITRWYL